MGSERDEAIRRADRLAERGQFDAAAVEYQRVLEAFPSDWATMNALGDLWVRAGAPDRAVPLFRQVADAYLAEGFHARAAGYLKKLLKVAPRDERAMLSLAEACAAQGLIVEAQKHLDAVGAAYRRRGDAAALTQLRQHALRLEQMAQTAQQARTFEVDAHQGASPELPSQQAPPLEDGDAPAQAPAPVTLPRLVSFEVDLTSELDALVMDQAAAAHVADDETTQAMPPPGIDAPGPIDRGSEEPPHAPRDLIAFGRGRFEAGRGDEAIAVFLAAAHEPGSRYEASVALSEVYIQRGQLAAGVEWLEQAAEAAETPARRGATLYRLGVLLEEINEPARALAVLLEVNVLAPGFRDVAERVARLSSASSGGGPSGP